MNGQNVLNEVGKMVELTWLDLPNHCLNVELDEYIIMPNHFHGLIHIVGAGSKPALNHDGINTAPDGMNMPQDGMNMPVVDVNTPHNGGSCAHGLSEIVRQFKTFSAKRVNQINQTRGVHFWQRGFYEHVVRNEFDLFRIRQYIVNNPSNWATDDENPDYVKNN